MLMVDMKGSKWIFFLFGGVTSWSRPWLTYPYAAGVQSVCLGNCHSQDVGLTGKLYDPLLPAPGIPGSGSIIMLLDVGCAECKFLRGAHNIPFLQKISGLDLDTELLQRSKRAVEPLICDFIHKYKEDQVITLYSGSIAERDESLLTYDVVTAIEVIEHLYPPVLQQMEENVFGYINPKLVVVTTPNSEFNVLFPDFSGFRHWDHKFEWTRAEFQAWADGIACKYGYSVEYSGVGDPPEHHSHVGHCSQMAVFVRKSLTAKRCNSLKPTTKYEEVYSVVYKGHHYSDEEVLEHDIYDYVNQVFRWREDGDTLLLRDMSGLLEKMDSLEHLADIIERLEFQLTSDRSGVVVNKGWRSCSQSAASDSAADVGEVSEKVPEGEKGTLVEEDEMWDL